MKTTFKKLILDDLKAMKRIDIVNKIKSIKYESFAGGDSVTIKAIDLSNEQQLVLKKLAYEYQEGDFDGMHDIYNYKKESSKLRVAKYVHVCNEYSNETKEKAVQYLANDWGVKNGEDSMKKFGVWLDTAIHRVCSGVIGKFEIK